MTVARLLLTLFLTCSLCFNIVACRSTGDDDDSACSDDGDSADDDDSADAHDAAGPDGILLSLSVRTGSTDITTRETSSLIVEGSYDDGSVWDLTEEAVYHSSDESILKVYTPGIAQPLGSGTSTITASVSGLVSEDSVEITVALAAAEVGDLVINELMMNPNSLDINGDSDSDSSDDEFVEIGNAADAALDLSGVRILDAGNTSPRHVFAAGTVLGVGHTIVVFGGGDISALSEDNATFLTTENDDTLQHGLALNNDEDTVRLIAADGLTEISSASYDPTIASALLGASLTLWDPEVYGTDYTSHQFAPGRVGNFSPGRLLTGESFPGPDGVFGDP